MSSIITHMPLDVWDEILIRLGGVSDPIEGRVQSVIDDPCFVRAHTNNHHHQQISSNIIIQNRTFSPATPCYSLDLEALISCRSIAAMRLDLGFISYSPAGLSLPVASCNGLILTQKPLAIWNPLTHERFDPPPAGDFPPPYDGTTDDFGLGYHGTTDNFGLGYDGTTDDYKAVVILRTRDSHVYSLKLDSWRSIMHCRPPSKGE